MKVVVYFTDGYVNTIQDKLSCSGTLTLYNYGGYDSGSTVDVFRPYHRNLSCDLRRGFQLDALEHLFEECDQIHFRN